MARNPEQAFGWDYPAGAEHDPSAPYNQPDVCERCEGTQRVPDPSTMMLKPNGEPDSCMEDMDCPDCTGDAE